MTLYVRATPDKGSGVYAGRDFPPGSEILRFGGAVLHANEVPNPLLPEDDHYLQIGVGRYLGPSGGLDDLVNHSCDPNCKVVIEGDVATLVALRAIPQGTEVTFDYSTTSTEDPVRWALQCCCGAPSCRKTVSGYHTLPMAVQNDYRIRSMVPAYVLEHFVPYWLGLN